MKRNLKIGVIGAGGIANNVHLPSLMEIEGCTVSAICDLRAERAKAAAEKFKIERVYSSQYTMLSEEKELDGILVLVEPDRMFRAASECLDAGYNILIEKPAGINSYQAESLERKTKKNGVMCAVAMNRRHIPLVQHVIKHMNEITEITQVDGCFIKNNDIADAWSYADAYLCDIVHAGDLVRYIAKSEISTAATIISKNNSPVNNAWSSVMRFENGITGTLRASYQTGGRVHNFEIHGAQASAFINLGHGDAMCEADILYFNGHNIYSMASEGGQKIYRAHFNGMEIAGGNEYHQYYGYMHEDIDFLNCLRNGGKPLCDISDAVGTMRMMEMLLEKRI